jgi:hypothetical protein
MELQTLTNCLVYFRLLSCRRLGLLNWTSQKIIFKKEGGLSKQDIDSKMYFNIREGFEKNCLKGGEGYFS